MKETVQPSRLRKRLTAPRVFEESDSAVERLAGSAVDAEATSEPGRQAAGLTEGLTWTDVD